MNIRQAKMEDIDDLAELWYDLATMHEDIMEGYELSEDPKSAWTEMMEDFIENPNWRTFIAEDDGIVGFVTVGLRKRADFFRRQKMGMIMDLFVKEDRRGEGIGTALVSASESWIKEKGFEVAVLTVAPENQGAVDFWKEHGYRTYLYKQRKEL
ncbi:MAG: N-acetyltransferase family protein [Thermoplasmatota archaeon]